MATIVVAGFIVAESAQNFISDNARQAFLARTKIAAAGIDPELVAALNGTAADTDSSQYTSLKNQLIAIKSASNDMHFVYLMGLKNKNIVFLVDAEPANSKDYSPPGEIYSESSAELIEIFESGQAFVEGPITDKYGTWISGHAPIHNIESDKVIAIIGIDIDADNWKKTVNLHRWESIGITFLLVALLLVYFIALWRISYVNKIRQSIATELEHAIDELSDANQYLDAFSYSVSHDLRAPLRHIHGYSEALEEDYHDKLTGDGLQYLQRLRYAVQSMDCLIQGLLTLARVNKHDLDVKKIDLTTLAQDIIKELDKEYTDITYQSHVDKNMVAFGDARLLRVVLENLISNAYKYTRHTENPHIEIGATEINGITTYYVKDNGAGFDMAHYDKLFEPFQRLHHADDFEGLGIGLSTVARIVRRHKGRIWAEGSVGTGATIYFTLGFIKEMDTDRK